MTVRTANTNSCQLMYTDTILPKMAIIWTHITAKIVSCSPYGCRQKQTQIVLPILATMSHNNLLPKMATLEATKLPPKMEFEHTWKLPIDFEGTLVIDGADNFYLRG